jgi:quinate/shikimate dehydrogenase (NAD+)
MTVEAAEEIRLGLIGVGIERSRAPELHRLAGKLCGITITYDLFSLDSKLPGAFDDALTACRSRGYRGINVTHPFKERAAEVAGRASEGVRRLGAVNTIRLDSGVGTQGFNTDYTGFKRAFRSRFLDLGPGTVAIVGAGGVGRAIAFGLADSGVQELRLFDQDGTRSERLAMALRGHADVRITLCSTVEEAVGYADGLVNATPLGMYRHPGTPIPRGMIGTQSWAFDAVYTPTRTRFLQDATEAGLEVLSGYELFFYQGIDAFEVFTGLRVDEAQLRAGLSGSRNGP